MARSVSMSQKDIFYLDSLAKLLGISQSGPGTNDRKWDPSGRTEFVPSVQMFLNLYKSTKIG